MKKILVLMLAMVTIVASQAQKERIPEQRSYRNKMMADRIKLSDEQKQKAKSLNENNPRVYILEGQDKFFTPEQFGGSKEEAKKLFEKANGIFQVSKPANTIEPQWGRGQVAFFLGQIK